MQKGGVTLLPELVVQLGVHPAHRLHHLLAELHRRRERLGVPPQDVPEVYVEQGSGFCEEKVIEVAVAYTWNMEIHLYIYFSQYYTRSRYYSGFGMNQVALGATE